MTRAALYPRVSTQEQYKDGYSIGEQIERMTKYCESQGIDVYKIYEEKGFSGANMERPALKTMLHDAEQHLFDVVVVYKLDRLSRSQRDTLEIIEDVLIPNNVDIVSITESFDTGSPMGRFMISILSTFAELEKSKINERMEMGIESRAKSGLWTGTGNPPIGYRYVDGELKVHPYEAFQVGEVFKLFNMRISQKRIVQIMDNKGYLTHYGKWKYRSIKNVLRNRIYIGEVSFRDKWFKGKHEPIVTEEDFYKAQAILDERLSEARRRGRYESPIVDLIECGKCGSHYIVHSGYKKKDGNITRYYGCVRRFRYTEKYAELTKDERCKNKAYRVEVLEGKILEQVKQLALHPDSYTVEEKKDEKTEKIKLLNERILTIDNQLDRLLELYAEGLFDVNKIKAKTDPLHEEKSKLLLEIKSLQHDKTISRKDAVELACSLDAVISNGDTEEIRSIIHELIDSIVIDGDDIHIYWNFK